MSALHPNVPLAQCQLSTHSCHWRSCAPDPDLSLYQMPFRCCSARVFLTSAAIASEGVPRIALATGLAFDCKERRTSGNREFEASDHIALAATKYKSLSFRSP